MKTHRISLETVYKHDLNCFSAIFSTFSMRISQNVSITVSSSFVQKEYHEPISRFNVQERAIY